MDKKKRSTGLIDPWSMADSLFRTLFAHTKAFIAPEVELSVINLFGYGISLGKPTGKVLSRFLIVRIPGRKADQINVVHVLAPFVFSSA